MKLIFLVQRIQPFFKGPPKNCKPGCLKLGWHGCKKPKSVASILGILQYMCGRIHLQKLPERAFVRFISATHFAIVQCCLAAHLHVVILVRRIEL